MARFLIPLVIFLVLAGFLAAGLKLDPHEVPSPLINKPAPAFALPLVDRPDTTISHKDLLGKVWMLNVWASWCGACREEHPVLMEFAKARIVPIYGLDYKDTRDNAQKWLRSFGNPYEASLFDGNGRIGIDYGVYGVPETFIIDKLGVVRMKHIGPVTPQVLRDKIVPLLKELNA